VIPATPRLSNEEKKIRKAAVCKAYRDNNKELIEEKRKVRQPKINAAAKILRRTAKHKNSTLLRKYGIGLDAWNDLFLSQGSVCAICRTDTPTSKKGWATDHCHTTGRVRGILCSHCNVMLGMSCERPATLAAAITYLTH
jgi:hypothetical protein